MTHAEHRSADRAGFFDLPGGTEIDLEGMLLDGGRLLGVCDIPDPSRLHAHGRAKAADAFRPRGGA